MLDANILIRAVLGARVRSLVEAHCERVAFFVAGESLLEAENYLGKIAPSGASRRRSGGTCWPA